jgi:hypothetical protein
LFSRYKGIWSEIATKMQGVKGYPVKSSFTLALGGPQCKNSNAQQAHPAPDSAGGSDNSGSSDSSSPGSLAGAVAGKLGGLFHKKKDDAQPAAQPAAAATPVAIPPGDVPLMTVSSQLVSVSTNGASAAVFTVPADFKKQEPKQETKTP